MSDKPPILPGMSVVFSDAAWQGLRSAFPELEGDPKGTITFYHRDFLFVVEKIADGTVYISGILGDFGIKEELFWDDFILLEGK